jgi:cytochrome P450
MRCRKVPLTSCGYQLPLLLVLYNLILHPLAAIPGPPAWSISRLPFIISLLRGTLVQDIQRLHRKYGPILRIAPNEVTSASPDAWTDILNRSDRKEFLKDPVWWSPPGDQPHVSILTAIDPEHHGRIRKALAPGFTKRALKENEEVIQRYVGRLIERLREQAAAGPAVVDMSQWMIFTTFDLFGELGFGESFSCLESSRLHPWIELIFKRLKANAFFRATKFYPPLAYLLRLFVPRRLKKMAAAHFQQIVDKVNRRLNWEVQREDLMAHAVRGGMPLGEIYATFSSITIAGSETTATALTGTVHYLVNNKEKLEMLAREVRGRFQRRDEMSTDALAELPYLTAVIKEGLRLCPPISWVLPRIVPKGGASVCGVWLPDGTPVSIQAYAMCRDPAYFHEPDEFLPERWLSDTTNNSHSVFFGDKREAVQPFGAGSRVCLGRESAWAQMRLILGRLVWEFDIESMNGEEMTRWEDLRTFVLWEKRPVEVRIKQRQASLKGGA